MKIYSWKTDGGNFGDDLNEWLWSELMPGDWPDCDDTLLCGVGTILTQELPRAPRLVVFGSGAGYGALPADLGKPWFQCYGFRGPLTTKLCGFEESKVLADPAILIPGILPAALDLKSGPIFVPHVHSAKRANWLEVCNRAGIEYLDPRGESKRVIQKIASSSLILAESMHAAIIADAYRVPWLPIWSTREISYFKWLDWALSVGAKVHPNYLPAPSWLSWLDHHCASLAANANSELTGVDTKTGQIDFDGVIKELSEIANWRSTATAKNLRKNYLRVRDRLFKPTFKLLGESDRRLDQAAKKLSSLATHEGILSDDAAFAKAKGRLLAALEVLKLDRRQGFPNLEYRPTSE